MNARLLSCIFLLSYSVAPAENWEVLVLSVEERLVEPTLERGLSRYPEDLAEAIEKLRPLAPDRGVVEYLHFEVQGGDVPFKQREGGMRMYEPPSPGVKKQSVGREVLWERTEDNETRVLFLNAIEAPQQVFQTRIELHHRLQSRWALSATVAWGEGALFVFERLVGGKVEAGEGKTQWLFSALLTEEPDSDRESAIHRSIVSAEKGRAVLLRFPDVESEPETVTVSRHPSVRMKREFLDRRRGDSSTWTIRYAAAPAEILQVADSLRPRRGLLDMTLVEETGPSNAVVHRGSASVALSGEAGVAPLDAKVRKFTVEGTRTRDEFTGKEETYFVSGRVVEPR